MGDKPFTLLVVDDSQGMLAQLARTLGAEDFALTLAPPGPDALRGAGEVDLVVLCLGAAPDEGLDLLRRLNVADSPERPPPVLALVPEEDRRARLAALRLGAEVLTSPWDDEELSLRVYRVLRQQQRLDVLEERLHELQKLSTTDGLTQIHNHRYFQERLREEFRRAQRYDDALSLIFLDLDHFKSINDRFGHMTGDGVLREVAAALLRSVRETDLVARYGGEEFAVLLPRTHLTGALTVAERIARELAGLKLGPDGSLRVTASLGISGFPHRTVLTSEQLVLTADEALYRAKREGRNKICLHPQLPLLATSQAS
ncbi:diguanylate cyclase [Myxococcaceae bacterium GXIMD 01537]